MVWIQNRDNAWWNRVNGIPVEPVKDVNIELSEFKDGEYLVEWWGTYNGTILRRETVKISGGKLQVAIKSLIRDVALKTCFMDHGSVNIDMKK